MKSSFFVLVITICLSTSNTTIGQLQNYNAQRYKTDQKLMIGLGSWASMNIVGSGIGWAVSTNDESKYFHQMNTMWNLVNLGLAIPGYIKAKKSDPDMSLFKTIDEQRKTETVFLINAGIDLAYISSGILLKNMAQNVENRDQFSGYGKSLILQGGFLLLFDWIAFGIHRKHAAQKLAPILERIEPSDLGIGLKINLDSQKKSIIETHRVDIDLN